MQAKTDKSAINNRMCAWHTRLLLVASVGLAFLPVCVQARTYLLIKSGNGEIYQRFQVTLNTALNELNPENILVTRNLTTFKANPDTESFDAVVTAGIEASIAISEHVTKSRVLMTMLPERNYQSLSTAGEITCAPANCRVIFLDQPVSRQLRLIKIALPGVRNIAVVGSADSKALRDSIEKNSTKLGLRVDNIFVRDETTLLSAIQESLGDSQLLMAIPDHVIYNRNTARVILLASFNRRTPLFAYSRSFVRAGATFGIYSSPEDIARQVAELLCCIGNIRPQKIYPKYFTIDVNQHAAEALNIIIPDAGSLKQQLDKHESK